MGSQQVSITLPDDLLNFLKAKVASGEYPSESDVIRDGLSNLLMREQSMEDWLMEVGSAYDALRANPERGISAAHVRSRVNAEHTLTSGG